MRPLAICTIIGVTAGGTVGPALALTGGGTAPGGPLSGSMRPSCNGYNMDGTRNASPGANRPGCTDLSARAIHRSDARRLSR